MKLDRLSSYRDHPAGEAGGVVRTAQQAPRIDALDAVDADRQRSLQQEVATIEAMAIGDFHGRERLLQDARSVAHELIGMGPAAKQALVSLGQLSTRAVRLLHLDDQA